MKNHVLAGSLCFLLLLSACSEDDSENSEPTAFSGTIQEIEDLFTPGVVETLTELEFSVNEGDTPPNVEGTYFMSPFVVLRTNVPGDRVGNRVFNQRQTFSNQDNRNNTIDIYGEQLDLSQRIREVLNGEGFFISGSGNDFSIFFIINNVMQDSGEEADSAYIISGTMDGGNIANAEAFIVMMDNNGNPSGLWIPNNTGRVFSDTDGISERVTTNESGIYVDNFDNLSGMAELLSKE